jgi:hypothetical protein
MEPRSGRVATITMGLTLLLVGFARLALSADTPLPPWESPFSTDPSRAYHCLRARAPITIDGRLAEADWGRAQRIGKLTIAPEVKWETLTLTPPRDAKSPTMAMLLWDDRGLYFAAVMADLDIYELHEKGHDLPFGWDDIIELFVKPSREQPFYWEFHVTPKCTTRDYFYARRSAGGDERWMPYHSGMKASVSVRGTLNHWEDRDQDWTVEMSVPWSAFARMGGRPKVGDRWTFLVSRYDYSVYLDEGVELSAAAPLPRAAFHLYESYPFMVFDN